MSELAQTGEPILWNCLDIVVSEIEHFELLETSELMSSDGGNLVVCEVEIAKIGDVEEGLGRCGITTS